jgi:hypothetical protein
MASGSSLNIISFDVPYPANYGGVIDIFYKIKELYEKGIKIILHCFVYGDREEQYELNKYCEQVYYYPRNEKLTAQLSLDPYIVQSRKNKELLINLLSNDYPILFEGLHSCVYLDHWKLRKRKKMVRMHNIEWQYYLGLIPQAVSWKHKLYYGIESYKLKKFERVLYHTDIIFSVSADEVRYCSVFAKTIWLPAFHGNTLKDFQPSASEKKYILYHGNLDITDNQKAALLLDEICSELNIDCIIAGKNINSQLSTLNSQLFTNPSDAEMQKLIEDSHICFIYSDMENGVKLKLLYSLFNGKFVIANMACITGTKLDSLVIKAETKEGIKKAIAEYLQKEFTEEEFNIRKALLQQYYDNDKNIELILEQL